MVPEKPLGTLALEAEKMAKVELIIHKPISFKIYCRVIYYFGES
jgi:hypothetical protein